MGATIGLVMWFLDRQVRQARVQAAQRAATPAEERRKTRSGGGGGPRLAPSPITRRVTAEGVVEAAPAMGLAMNKRGMWIFLGSEVMVVTALIPNFLSLRVRGMMDIAGESLIVPV